MNDTFQLWQQRILRLLFVLLCVRLFSHAGTILSDLLFDQDHSLWRDLTHHTVQMLPAITVMLLLNRSFSFRDIGFNLNEWRWSLRAVLIFTILWTAGTILSVMIFGTELDPEIDDIIFALTLNGLSDELLYRAFVIGMLFPLFSYQLQLFGSRISVAGILSAAIFALAHISFSFSPLGISHIDPLQQLLTLTLGIVYALSFERTHSLLAPVLMHGIADTLILLAAMLPGR